MRLKRIFTNSNPPEPAVEIASSAGPHPHQLAHVETASAGLATGQLLHQLLHLLARLQDAVDVRHLGAAAAGDPAATRSVDALRVAALLPRHGLDHRLHAADVALGLPR